MINETTNSIKKMKKVILAISAETIATPVKPNTPAIIEITKKVMTHSSIAKLAKLAPVIYNTRDRTKKIRKTKKIILAISTEIIAKPVNPNTAANIAMIKNKNTHPNILSSLFRLSFFIVTEMSLKNILGETLISTY